jgi:DNA-binding MarR family transcriptional regulator
MGKPVTLLESLCDHVRSIGAESIEVKFQDGRYWVHARSGNTGFPIANFAGSSRDGKELRLNLNAAAKKPVRAVLGGQLSIIKVGILENSGSKVGNDTFDVTIEAAAKRDPSLAPKFTRKQGQYLAFIHYYSKIHKQAPAESDLERYFRVSPPSVHEMIKTLERNGLIERAYLQARGQARSIRLLVREEHLPKLE